MPSITGLLALVAGSIASLASLALVVASSPLVGAGGNLTAVYGWSMACVFGVLLFGSGLASQVTPG